MSLQPEISTDNAITACDIRAGRIQINRQNYTHSVLLSAHELTPIAATHLTELDAAHWQAIVEFAPEVLLIGTGTAQRFPEPALLAPLYAAHIGIEIMNSDAAARTYNVLMHENRRVLALILLP